jgi:DNA-binding transcriptional LysR family regulator
MLGNRSGEMEVFVRVYETGSFSAAARQLTQTPSAIAKLIARLEQRLGILLFRRSTRSLRPTAEGDAYYDRARAILAEIDDADSSIGQNAVAPRGRIRINTTVPFGTHVLLPILKKFLDAYPAVTLDLNFTDDVVDILAERTDVAIRVGPLKDSRLLKRKIGTSPRVMVASPSYLNQHPAVQRARDLGHHNCLNFNFRRSVNEVTLNDDGVKQVVPMLGNVIVNNGETLRLLTLSGLGIARLAQYHVAGDIKAGRLVQVLAGCETPELEEIHAVFLGAASGSGALPVRTRLFIDFVVDHARNYMGAA